MTVVVLTYPMTVAHDRAARAGALAAYLKTIYTIISHLQSRGLTTGSTFCSTITREVQITLDKFVLFYSWVYSKLWSVKDAADIND